MLNWQLNMDIIHGEVQQQQPKAYLLNLQLFLREQQRPCLSASSTLPDRKSQCREGQESEDDGNDR